MHQPGGSAACAGSQAALHAPRLPPLYFSAGMVQKLLLLQGGFVLAMSGDLQQGSGVYSGPYPEERLLLWLLIQSW